MIAAILSKVFMAVFSGGALGLFFGVLLNANGIKKATYKYTAIIIGSIVFIASLFSFEAGGVAIAIMAIGVFVLAIALFVRGIGGNLRDAASKLSRETDANSSEVSELPTRPKLINYYGLVFHLIVIVLISLSIFTYSNDTLLSQKHMDRLIQDFIFQFNTTVMFMIIGIFNPFIKPGEKLLKLAELINRDKYPLWYKVFSDARSWMFIKAIICVLIIRYLLGGKYLVLPDWNTAIDNTNGYTILIYIFIFFNIIQLIRNPEFFFKKNMLRLSMLFRSAYMGIFVAAIMVFATMFGSALMGIDTDMLKVSSESILFLGFNIVMAYNEYKVAGA